jgi:hypothetical protein
MGLWQWLRRWLVGKQQAESPRQSRGPCRASAGRRFPRHPQVRLTTFRATASRKDRQRRSGMAASERVAAAPYRFARPCVVGGWLELSRDGDSPRLQQAGLPVLHTPQALADWLGLPLGKLAWLVHRFEIGQAPAEERRAHYHFRWLKKRTGGKRLLESPKPTLRRAQQKVLREILDKIPVHSAAHGFVAGRSILTNAAPHLGQRVIVKFDLVNFYPGVGFSRVTAIFRSLGYSREGAIWLARLTTSALPPGAVGWAVWSPELEDYLTRHLPQGAPTSPALANLSAFSLDLRLAGLARSFGAHYTRYADDLTFSGDDRFLRSLAVFIPLVEQLVRAERFRTNKAKRRVIRSHRRQQVAGVVVNQRPNVSRRDYDRLKAVLTNCVRRGASTQNHERIADFAAHLRGRIAHVAQLNPARGRKLLVLFEQVDWAR